MPIRDLPGREIARIPQSHEIPFRMPSCRGSAEPEIEPIPQRLPMSDFDDSAPHNPQVARPEIQE